MAAQTLAFTFTGTLDEWLVPRHTAGTLRVTCFGADGGRFPSPDGDRGRGGSVRGYLTVAPGTPLYMAVGQSGGPQTFVTSFGSEGGYPGNYSGDGVQRGGGATEVRTSTSSTARIMVAGGGGSGAGGGGSRGFDGALGIGSGESASGADANYAHGGTTSAAGAAPTNPGGWTPAGTAGSGSLGGNGTYAYGPTRGGGGGGGYYGGGGGGVNNSGSASIGGGGGSSWCDTGVFSTVDHAGYNNDPGGNGDGYIVIEWDGDPVWVPATGWFAGHPWG